LHEIAARVLGANVSIVRWMMTTALSFDGPRPGDLLATAAGRERVRNHLARVGRGSARSVGTTPADVGQALQVVAGDRVGCLEIEPVRFEVVAATRSITELKGMFGKTGKNVSIEHHPRGLQPHASECERSQDSLRNVETR
jgi:hypothetical protein